METKKLIKQYSQQPIIRALVQAIPHIGGSIDTLIFEKSTKWRDERLEELFSNFKVQLETNQERLKEIEAKTDDIVNNEDFYDLFLFAVNAAIKTKSKEKIKRFSNIVSNFILDDGLLEKAKVGLMIEVLNDLSEFEISLMLEIENNVIQYDLYENDLYVKGDKLLAYLEGNQISFGGSTDIPDHVKIHSEQFFFLNRLQSMQLINKTPTNFRRSGSYSFGNRNQRTSCSVPFQGQLQIELTDFGEDFFKWVSDFS
ncbi:MAG: hypothetical protein JRE64_23815 [Deltaproteobacteria bacterium]|nr:hypothetical protein [Deltaproteobacteria bacterium]